MVVMTLFSTNNDMNMGESIVFSTFFSKRIHVEPFRLSIYIQCLSSLAMLCYDFTPWSKQVHDVVWLNFGEFNKLPTADIFVEWKLCCKEEKRDQKNEKPIEKKIGNFHKKKCLWLRKWEFTRYSVHAFASLILFEQAWTQLI